MRVVLALIGLLGLASYALAQTCLALTELTSSTGGSLANPSPFGVGTYSGATMCEWRIHVDGAKNITLTFMNFTLADGDYLLVQNSLNSAVLNNYTSSMPAATGATLTSPSGNVTLTFVAGESSPGAAGFVINYQPIFPPTAPPPAPPPASPPSPPPPPPMIQSNCDTTLVTYNTPNGEIVTPIPNGINNPAVPTSSRYCVFQITINAMLTMKLSVVNGSLASGESFEIYSGDYTAGGGTLLTATGGFYTPTANMAYVKFSNTGSSTGSFALSWSIGDSSMSYVCVGGTLAPGNLTRAVRLPARPDIVSNYPPNSQCTWTIPVGDKPVMINVKSTLNLGDAVTLYTSTGGVNTLYQTLTGSMSTTVTPTTAFVIVFSSDALYEGTGVYFTFGYTGGGPCSNELNVDTSFAYGLIAFPCPYGTTSYTGPITVDYLLRTNAYFNNISIALLNFQIGNLDILKFYDGLAPLGEPFLILSGHQAAPIEPIVSPTGNVYIRMVASDDITSYPGFQLGWATVFNPSPGQEQVITPPESSKTQAIIIGCVVGGFVLMLIVCCGVRKCISDREAKSAHSFEQPGRQDNYRLSVVDTPGQPGEDGYYDDDYDGEGGDRYYADPGDYVQDDGQPGDANANGGAPPPEGSTNGDVVVRPPPPFEPPTEQPPQPAAPPPMAGVADDASLLGPPTAV